MDRRRAHDLRPNPSDTWGGLGDDKNGAKKEEERPSKRPIEEHPQIAAIRKRLEQRGSGTYKTGSEPAPKAPEKREVPWNQALGMAMDNVPEKTLSRFLASLAEDRGRTAGIAGQIFKEAAGKFGAEKIGKLSKDQFTKTLEDMPGKRDAIIALLDRLSTLR